MEQLIVGMFAAIGLCVVLFGLFITLCIISAARTSSQRYHPDPFAMEELRQLREKRGSVPKITRHAGRSVVTREGKIIPRDPPSGEIFPGDMLDFLKGRP